jgi:hypothetical protein
VPEMANYLDTGQSEARLHTLEKEKAINGYSPTALVSTLKEAILQFTVHSSVLLAYKRHFDYFSHLRTKKKESYLHAFRFTISTLTHSWS